jgi:cytochrome c oxidase subunit 3
LQETLVNEHAVDAPHGEDFLHHEEASIFPLIAGAGVASTLWGLATLWNDHAWGVGVLMIGLTVAACGLIGWWTELVHANKSNKTTLLGTPEDVQRGLRLGFAFMIGSEVMFFAAFFAFYFYIRFHSPSWPPPGYSRLPIPPALLNTALLVSSGLIYHAAEHRLKHEKAKGGTLGLLLLAVVLGLTFLGVQANEWATLIHEGFKITDGTMGTAFYLLTGFHGAHVIVGAIFLSVVFIRVILGHFTAHKHFAMTAAGWYWHFVDVVWIGLVLSLYIF